MENYYKKYKLWTLYFGAFHSGKRYYFPILEINPIQFNRFLNPYYIDFLTLPENGYISFINFLEPLHQKALKNGADSNYFLPERTDTLEIDFIKLRDAYGDNCDEEIVTKINYFGNDLVYEPTGGNLKENKWSKPEELYSLMYNLSLTYTGNITGSPYGAKGFSTSPLGDGSNKLTFSGIGYGLNNCYGCIEDISYSITSGNIEKEYYPNCDTPFLEVKNAKFTIKYNIYNLFYNNASSTTKLLTLNSEKIDLNKIPFINYITLSASKQEILSGFKTGTQINSTTFTSTSIETGITEVTTLFPNTLNSIKITGTGFISKTETIESLARRKNEIPLLFRTLNFNSPTLVAFDENDNFYRNEVLNASGGFISSYKYVPNLECQEKVYGSRIFNVHRFLEERGIAPSNYAYEIYNSLVSGISAYEYEITGGNYLPALQTIKESRSANLYLTFDSGALITFSSGLQAIRLTGNSLGLGNPNNDSLGFMNIALNQSANILVAGAYNADTNGLNGAGAVYVFTGSENNWIQAVRLTGSGSVANDFIGDSIALNRDGNILAAGGYGVDVNGISVGAVHIFTGAGNTWNQTARLTGDTLGLGNPNGSYFGSSVSLNSLGNILAIGAGQADTNSLNAGAAYIFTGTGTSWNQTARLTGNTLGLGSPANDIFGFSISLNQIGNTVAIGAYSADTNGLTAGAVYIFTGAGNTWNQTARLTGNTLGLGNPNGDNFGWSISFNSQGNILAVGAKSADTNGLAAGAVYIFTGAGNTWNQTARLTGNTLGLGNPNGDGFGSSVSFSSFENMLAVGADNADTNGLMAGAVYVFTGDSESWSLNNQVARFTGNTLGLGDPNGDSFGNSVHFSSFGDVLAIGANSADTNGLTAGAVYVFTGNIINISGNLLVSGVPISQSPGDSGIKKDSIFYTDNLSLKFQLNSVDNLSFIESENLGPTIIKNKVNFNKNYYQNNYGDLVGFYMDAIIQTSGTGISGNLPPFSLNVSGKNFQLGKDFVGITYNKFSPANYSFNSLQDGIKSLQMKPRSTFLFTGGFTGGLPISIFFVESGIQFSGQKTIQSLNKSGFITTRSINTGALIGFSGITYTRLRNPIFNNDFQIGNLLMDTGRLLYYVNNTLIYSGNTGFNLEYMLLGSNNTRINNFSGTGITGILNTILIDNNRFEDVFASAFPEKYYNDLYGFDGKIHEILIYDSFVNENYKNKIYSYLTNKWSGIYRYGPSGLTTDYENRINFPKNYKTNSSDYDLLINATPKENEKHILLLEYNLYGFSGTPLDICDIDMHAYMIKTGFHEEIVKKDPFKSRFSINFNSGILKDSLQKIDIRNPNVNNVCDMNYTCSSFGTGFKLDYLKNIEANVLYYKPPKFESCIPDYIKYGKIYGNTI